MSFHQDEFHQKDPEEMLWKAINRDLRMMEYENLAEEAERIKNIVDEIVDKLRNE
tara:strand:- start:19 stop:183 length:165 start_codon:yes stop_codon:yes gene_type:complete